MGSYVKGKIVYEKKMISLKREAFLLLVTWRGWKILRRK